MQAMDSAISVVKEENEDAQDVNNYISGFDQYLQELNSTNIIHRMSSQYRELLLAGEINDSR